MGNLLFEHYRYGLINRAFNDWMVLNYGKNWRNDESDRKIECLRSAFVSGMLSALVLVDSGADHERLQNDCYLAFDPRKR